MLCLFYFLTISQSHLSIQGVVIATLNYHLLISNFFMVIVVVDLVQSKFSKSSFLGLNF